MRDGRDDTISRLIEQVSDIARQLRALQRLDVSPPPASIVTYDGTPTTGQLAQWTGAGTLTHSGYAGSAVARYSGVPTPGNYTYWLAAGTVADSGFGTADLPRYSGTPTAGQVAVWSSAGTIVGTADVPRYTGAPTAGNITYWAGDGTVAPASFGTADVVLTSGAQTIAGIKTFSDNAVFNGNVTAAGNITATGRVNGNSFITDALNLDDDDVFTIENVSGGFVMMNSAASTVGQNQYAIATFRCAATRFCTALLKGSDVETTTGTLTGTTGTDGKLTLSVNNPGGTNTIYVENRTGAVVPLRITVMGQ